MVGDAFDKAAKEQKTLEANSRALAAVLNTSPDSVDTGRALEIIAAGVDVNMRLDDENTLLICAAYAANTDVVCALLDIGANPNLANKRKETPLHYASKSLMLQAVEALVKHGADIYARDEFNDSVEDCALKGNAGAFGAAPKNLVVAAVRKGIDDRIQTDMNAALLRDEIKAFTTAGCATQNDVKPMKRLQIKPPGTES